MYKLCCDYHDYQTQKVIFFSAVVFSSVMLKNCPFGGMEKGQKAILDYPNFRHVLNLLECSFMQVFTVYTCTNIFFDLIYTVFLVRVLLDYKQ